MSGWIEGILLLVVVNNEEVEICVGVLVSRFACDKIAITCGKLVAVAGDAAGFGELCPITSSTTYKITSLPFWIIWFFLHKLSSVERQV